MTERDPISGSSKDYGATSSPPNVGFSEFSPAELFNLCEEVAENIKTMTSGLKSLEKMLKQIGGANDNVALRERVHVIQQNVNGCASSSARHMQRLAVLVRRGDKPQQLQVERLTNTFSETLASYATVQKQLVEKMAAHLPKQARVRNDPEAMERQAIADDEEASLIASQQAQTSLAQFETSMLLEREEYMNKIESDVLDVNEIMQNLASMVQKQAETVDTVASHIENTAAGVEAGRDELAKAAEHQRRYRRKMFIISIIAAVIAILLLVWVIKAFK